MVSNPFHLAIPVKQLSQAVEFYQRSFGCELGRQASRWADLNFFGHQLSLHLVDGSPGDVPRNEVDGHGVPARHFGVVLPWEDWQALAESLQKADTEFLIQPYVRFEGEVGEQGTLFLRDPSDNVLEFKSFRDPNQLFATR